MYLKLKILIDGWTDGLCILWFLGISDLSRRTFVANRKNNLI